MSSCLVNADQKCRGREAAQQFLDGRINYERDRAVPYRERDLKLARMKELLARLDNPHYRLPIVHVAGTKGKGSTAAIIGAIFSAAGYRTGVFTSPHLNRVEERIAVNGQPCSAEELVQLVDRVRPAVEAMDREAGPAGADEHGPTYFEIIAAMAMIHFARCRAEAVVLEVGLGGRLDATNVCSPRVCAISSIGFDHTRQLGTTLGSIAREKAGIVKPGVPVVSGVTDSEPREVIRQICRQRGSPLFELGVDFNFHYRPPRHLERAPSLGKLDVHSTVSGARVNLRGLPLRLLGRHQAANAAVALAVLAELSQRGWKISEDAIRAGLADVHWPARVELVARRPAIVLDSAHNPSSVEALVAVLEACFSVRRRLLVFSASRGKDIRSMLGRLLGQFDEVVFTQYLNNPRAVPAERLAVVARKLADTSCRVCPGPAEAWNQVRALATPDDLICVTGSVFIAGEMREHMALQPAVSPG